MFTTKFFFIVVIAAKGFARHGSEDDILTQRNTSTCPPWFSYDNITGQCECGDELDGIVSCDNKEKKVYVMECYCMTYDKHLGVVVGSCSTNCLVRRSDLSFHVYFNNIPPEVNNLNEKMCGKRWNRNGTLCGKCKDGYYPLAYSYNMSCTKCTYKDKYNWAKYICSAFIPLTIFFVFVLAFGISASSPQLEAFIIFAQIITTPANVRMILEALDSGKYPASLNVCRIIAALYGVWNLDFFRTLLPDNCLKLSTLQTLALDYVIAVYPLILIVFTYVIVDIYDRRCFLLVWVTKPFKTCLKKGNVTANMKSSILNAFVTFILLSYGKFLTVSFDLLVFTQVYASDGKPVSNALFYDASVEYFGHEHLPYGVIAIVITTFFNIIPLLFTLLHPIKCFSGCIGRLPALRICLDSFQGCYKDGTEGTRDCRFFSSLFLLIRIILFIVYGCIKNLDYYPFALIFLLVLVVLIVIFQPFKPQFSIYNTIYTSLILNLAVWNITMVCVNIAALKASYTLTFSVVLATITSILPLFYITTLLFKWLYSLKLVQYFCTRYCAFCRVQKLTSGMDDFQESTMDNSFPHRMEHISEEQPFHISSINNVIVSQYGTIQQRVKSTY